MHPRPDFTPLSRNWGVRLNSLQGTRGKLMKLHCQIEPNDQSIADSSPLIILHGLFGNWENWRTPMRKLAAQRTTVGIDLRNHGQSPHADSMSYPEMAQDVAETLSTYGVSSCSVIGHSMGGKVAMALTARTDVQIERLAIVDIAPRNYPPHHRDILKAMNALTPASLNSRREADEQMSALVTDSMTRQFLLKNLIRTPGQGNGFRWILNLSALTSQYDSLLEIPPMASALSQPVLVIRGGESDYVSDEDVSRFEGWGSSVQVETIAGAGHWPHASHGAEVSAMLDRFFL